MEWQVALLIIFFSLIVLMATGMPIAFCFLLINVVGVFVFWGGETGLQHLTFSLLPVPLLILMGEVMFGSGIAPLMMGALDKWLGRVSGRLSLLAVSGGTLFSTMSGVSLASTALLGSVLVPEMEKQGYKKSMTLGPILGSAGLAIMIPPSGLAVLLGAIGEINVGDILIAIIVPGLLMAVLYATYIVLRCLLQPSLAPSYEVSSVSILEKLVATARYVLPIGFIVFLVVGVIFLGIATPSEAAATGAIGALILAAAYRRLTWEVLKKASWGTLEITVMLLMIIVGAKAFGQILAFSGATRGMIDVAAGLPVSPIVIVIALMVVVLILGCFMDPVAIIMITLPIFVPIILNLGFDPVWFAVIMLLNIEMATTTPPFGMNLFVMKGVAPPDTTMGDIYKAALPFLGCDLIVMILLVTVPAIALWLPGLMR